MGESQGRSSASPAGTKASRLPGNSASEVPVEERVLGWKGAPAPLPTPAFTKFFWELLPRFQPGGTSQRILSAFAGMDVKVDHLAAILRSNSYFESQVMDVIKSRSNREEMPSVEAAVPLLGIQNTRNLVLALQARRMVFGGHAEWSKEGKIQIEPAKLLSFALKTEEYLESVKSEYAGLGYAAGYAFDVMALLSERLAEDKKATASLLESTFKNGLQVGKVATVLAQFVPGFSHQKHVFAAGLLHGLGKVSFAIVEPTIVSLMEDCSKKNVNRTVRVYLEEKRFGFSHAMLGAALVSTVRVLHPLARAIEFQHEPHLLAGHSAGLHSLAGVISLAAEITSSGQKFARKDDPAIIQLLSGTHRGLKIDPQAFVAASKGV